jgi:hypothetical protein
MDSNQISAFGSALGAIAAFFSIWVAWRVAQLSSSIATTLDAARKEADKRANAVRMSEKILSIEFYRDISAVVWEVYVKWMHWKGDNATAYKANVVSGFISYTNKYDNFSPGADQSNHNLIRFHNHFHPPTGDSLDPLKGFIQERLSEHQALTLWLEFWGNLHTMLVLDLIDGLAARQLLADWYEYFLPLMIELREVIRALEQLRYPGEPEPNWLKETELLEQFFYSDSKGKKYRASLEDAKERAKQIAAAINSHLGPTAVCT